MGCGILKSGRVSPFAISKAERVFEPYRSFEILIARFLEKIDNESESDSRSRGNMERMIPCLNSNNF